MLGIKSQALYILSKDSTTGLHFKYKSKNIPKEQKKKKTQSVIIQLKIFTLSLHYRIYSVY